MRTLLHILLICLLATITGAALAQTPDGQTPAQEVVCDEANFSGAAWGLCNAYCEAMDCDCPTASDPDCAPKASAKACQRTLDNFHKKRPDVILLCEAVLPPEFYDLEVTVIGGGIVTSLQEGEGGDAIDADETDPSTSSETYVEGTTVNLTAHEITGWTFDSWTGDCVATVADPLKATVLMDDNRTCTATFIEEVVEPVCGDGSLDAGEECDDGNNVDGDGCSASCTEEVPATCPCIDSGNWSDFDAGLLWEDFVGEILLPTDCAATSSRTEIQEYFGEGDFSRIAVDSGSLQCEAADGWGTSGTLSLASEAEANACAAILQDLAALAGASCG